MRRVFAFLVLLTALVMASVSVAADEKNKDPKARKLVDLSKVASYPSGVYNIEYDPKTGEITSLLVVGSSRISTVLGAAKGKKVASQRASIEADAEFVKFLKSEVKVYEKSEDEHAIFQEGNEGNNKDAMNEAGKSLERTSTKFERSAKGFLRGMQVAHYEISDKDKTYYLVKKWNSKTSEATKKTKADLDSDAPAKKGTPSKPGDKKLEDKKVTIDD